MAAIIEQSYDEKGIIWPVAVAPYTVIVTVVNSKKEDQQALGFEIYNRLKAKGIEVLIDDRNERAGVKFNDAELIGIPYAINVGKKADEGIVEFKERANTEKEELTTDEAILKVLSMLKA
jgi:prolyl-tRNA synthetase